MNRSYDIASKVTPTQISATTSPRYAWSVFAILFALMVVNYIDRQIVVSNPDVTGREKNADAPSSTQNASDGNSHQPSGIRVFRDGPHPESACRVDLLSENVLRHGIVSRHHTL